MIPVDDRASVQEVGLDGFERQAFTIAVTRESFKILIDGLYQHKTRAVERELCTNALDAQVDAGTEDIPFDIHLPSIVDATFSVRDYGVSMTHDEVMRIYTSVFTSTKTNSNTQVGQLGLGSKSPFAVTDSFQVETFLDGMKRTYLASIDTEGIPTMSFLMAEETDEANGVRVSFAVQARHYQEFANEMATVALGFKVKPNITGAVMKFREPDIEFENWTFYDAGLGQVGWDRYLIKQGCVLYPITPTPEQGEIVRSGTIVIDVPIGSVAVAASREALSFDDRTQEYINEIFYELHHSIGRYVSSKLEGCTTYLEAVKSAAKTNSTFQAQVGLWHGRPIPLNGKVDLNGDVRDEYQFHYAEKVGREVRELKANVSKVDVDSLSSKTFYIDRGQKILRRKLRLDEVDWYRTYILRNPTNKQLSALVRKWELRPDQIKSITALPDVSIARKGSFDRSGIYELDTYGNGLRKANGIALDEIDDFYIIPINKAVGGHVPLPKLRLSLVTKNVKPIGILSRALDLTDPVYLLTPQAYKHLDGVAPLWEDVAYEKIMENKAQYLEEYKASRMSGIFPEHIEAALVAAEELTPSVTKSSKSILLDRFPSVREMFLSEVADINATADGLKAKIYSKYPLLPHIDTYGYASGRINPTHITEYLNLKKEA